MIEDPLFEPWSVDAEPKPAPVGGSALGEPAIGPRMGEVSTVDFIRATAGALLDVVAARLRLSRHETSLHDMLDEPPHVLRFELKPWPGPLSDWTSDRAAVLEIGFIAGSADTVSAWCWLDHASEAPSEIATIPSSTLTASWLESVILDFVAKVLERS